MGECNNVTGIYNNHAWLHSNRMARTFSVNSSTNYSILRLPVPTCILVEVGGWGEDMMSRVLVFVKYGCFPTVRVCVCVQEFLALVEENNVLQQKMAVSTSYICLYASV